MRRETITSFMSVIAIVVSLISVTVAFLAYRNQRTSFIYTTTPIVKAWITDMQWPLNGKSDEDLDLLLKKSLRILKEEGPTRNLRVKTRWQRLLETCMGSVDLEITNTGAVSTTVRGVELFGRPVISESEHGRQLASRFVEFPIYSDGPFPVFIEPGKSVSIKGVKFEINPVRDIPQFNRGWEFSLRLYDIHGGNNLFQNKMFLCKTYHVQ